MVIYDRDLVICDDIMMTYALMMYADLWWHIITYYIYAVCT
jgi:hypothetical protein